MKQTLIVIGITLWLPAILLIGVLMSKNSTRYTLETYSGVGSGVYAHGTIVRVEDGQPIVVGRFNNNLNVDYPGTLEIKETN